jgi:hypothetical protein
MGVRGKSLRYDWQYITYFCDETKRKRRVGRHFSAAAAEKAFKKLRKIYSHESRLPGREEWLCWQEDRYNNKVRTTEAMDRIIYA